MPTLKIGARGPDVVQLQSGLNAALNLRPPLASGLYDVATFNAVKRFQRENWLVEDGEAGQGTQAAILGGEAYPPILHGATPFIPQPDEATCWAASTAMLTGTTVDAVIARTPNELILPGTRQIDNYSHQSQSALPAEVFARTNGIRLVGDQVSWTPMMLKAALRTGPLMLDMLWQPGTYGAGKGSPGHMILVVGIRGDGVGDGRGTTLRIHDPWPPRVGARYSVGYFRWITQVATRTYQAFQR